ncbi:MAG: cell division protein ZipA [Xanthomonadales bacterium]|nr:cell division protein ZipA [Xanthomonadales bacterium]NNL94193.1 cell division protein ZipA [Xanthomonadales bacterium]
MDITTFRWILIVVGIAIVAFIFLFGNPERKRKPRASRKRNRTVSPRREPTLEPENSTEPGDIDTDAKGASQTELDIQPVDREPPPPPPGPPPEKIVTLFLKARDNHRISGVDLLDAAVKSGMVFGQQDIFHRVMDDDGRIVFSMANLTKPGHFDKSAWNTMEIYGVTMFMTLPGPLGALDAWDAMLATSRRIAELLHADLLDESRSTFTRQREGQIREELREYARSKMPEG